MTVGGGCPEGSYLGKVYNLYGEKTYGNVACCDENTTVDCSSIFGFEACCEKAASSTCDGYEYTPTNVCANYTIRVENPLKAEITNKYRVEYGELFAEPWVQALLEEEIGKGESSFKAQRCCDANHVKCIVNGDGFCCNENQGCESDYGCCPKIDGVYPPVLTEDDLKNCKQIMIYSGNALVPVASNTHSTDGLGCLVKGNKCDYLNKLHESTGGPVDLICCGGECVSPDLVPDKNDDTKLLSMKNVKAEGTGNLMCCREYINWKGEVKEPKAYEGSFFYSKIVETEAEKAAFRESMEVLCATYDPDSRGTLKTFELDQCVKDEVTGEYKTKTELSAECIWPSGCCNGTPRKVYDSNSVNSAVFYTSSNPNEREMPPSYVCCEDTGDAGHRYGQSVVEACEIKAYGGVFKEFELCCPRYRFNGSIYEAEAICEYEIVGTATPDPELQSARSDCCSGTPYTYFEESKTYGKTFEYKNAGCCELDICASKGNCDEYEIPEAYVDTYYEHPKGVVTDIVNPSREWQEGQGSDQMCCEEYIWIQATDDTDQIESIKQELTGAYVKGDGNKECCYGKIFEYEKGKYDCCKTYSDMSVVTVMGAPEKISLCCSMYEDENGLMQSGTAYWKDGTSHCCAGRLWDNGDGTYECDACTPALKKSCMDEEKTCTHIVKVEMSIKDDNVSQASLANMALCCPSGELAYGTYAGPGSSYGAFKYCGERDGKICHTVSGHFWGDHCCIGDEQLVSYVENNITHYACCTNDPAVSNVCCKDGTTAVQNPADGLWHCCKEGFETIAHLRDSYSSWGCSASNQTYKDYNWENGKEELYSCACSSNSSVCAKDIILYPTHEDGFDDVFCCPAGTSGRGCCSEGTSWRMDCIIGEEDYYYDCINGDYGRWIQLLDEGIDPENACEIAGGSWTKIYERGDGCC